MSPSGRWVASFAMEFRRLGAAGFFPSDGKETKGWPTPLIKRRRRAATEEIGIGHTLGRMRVPLESLPFLGTAYHASNFQYMY